MRRWTPSGALAATVEITATSVRFSNLHGRVHPGSHTSTRQVAAGLAGELNDHV